MKCPHPTPRRQSLTGFYVAMSLRVTLKLRSSCPRLLGAGITVVHHQPHLAYAVPGIKPGASCMLGKLSIPKVQLLEECFCLEMHCASIATSHVLLMLHKNRLKLKAQLHGGSSPRECAQGPDSADLSSVWLWRDTPTDKASQTECHWEGPSPLHF